MATFVALAVFIGFSAYDIVVLGHLPNEEAAPKFDMYYIVRMLACIALSAYLVRSFPSISASGLPTSVSRAGVLSALLLWVFTAIFVLSPTTFYALAIEDGLVEWGSAILVFLGCILFLMVGFRLRGREAAIAFFMAVFLFVLGMEEVSWMQRVFAVETPAGFSGNGQNEFNLHNFQTDLIENLYYAGAFALLFLLPLLLTPIRHQLGKSFEVIPPTHSVALVSAPLAALNWDMWNIIPIQMMYWIAVFGLGALTVKLFQQKSGLWAHYGFVLSTVLITQLIYLLYGSAFVRPWDVTEYKELFIAIGFFAFAVFTFAACPSRVKRS